MVQVPPRPAPRATPRWSVVTPVPLHTPAGTPPMAGLPVAGSSVLVGPPLLPSAPRSGFLPMMSPVPGVPQVVSSMRL